MQLNLYEIIFIKIDLKFKETKHVFMDWLAKKPVQISLNRFLKLYLCFYFRIIFQ